MVVQIKCPNCEYVSDFIPPAHIHPGECYATSCELCGRIIYGTLPVAAVPSKSGNGNSLSESSDSSLEEVEHSGTGKR